MVKQSDLLHIKKRLKTNKKLFADIHNLENISSQTNSALLQDKKLNLKILEMKKLKVI